jgi:hypothetical protein
VVFLIMDNPSSDGQTKPSDSNPSANKRSSEHEEIALLFRMATDKLDHVEANASTYKNSRLYVTWHEI